MQVYIEKLMEQNNANESAKTFIKDIVNVITSNKINLERFRESGINNYYYVEENGTKRDATNLEVKKKANIVYREPDTYFDNDERNIRDMLTLLLIGDTKSHYKLNVPIEKQQDKEYENIKKYANILYKKGISNIEKVVQKYIAKEQEYQEYKDRINKLKDIHGKTKSTLVMLKEIVQDKTYKDELGYKIAMDCIKYKCDILTQNQLKYVLDIYNKMQFKEELTNELGLKGLSEEDCDIIRKVFNFDDKQEQSEKELYDLADKIVRYKCGTNIERQRLNEMYESFNQKVLRSKHLTKEFKYGEVNKDLGKLREKVVITPIKIDLNNIYSNVIEYINVEEMLFPLD